MLTIPCIPLQCNPITTGILITFAKQTHSTREKDCSTISQPETCHLIDNGLSKQQHGHHPLPATATLPCEWQPGAPQFDSTEPCRTHHHLPGTAPVFATPTMALNEMNQSTMRWMRPNSITHLETQPSLVSKLRRFSLKDHHMQWHIACSSSALPCQWHQNLPGTIKFVYSTSIKRIHCLQ